MNPHTSTDTGAMTLATRVGEVSAGEIGALRERFLSDPQGTDLSLLRPVIARSWQRSRALNVRTGADALGHTSEHRVDEQLLLAAAPVISELERVCIESGGTVVLTDAQGTLALMRGHASELRRAESLYATTGTRMSEDLIGTNSDGTAIEEERAVQVWGAEHFNETLQSSYCTSVPIKDPIRRSTRGVLGLMLPESVGRDASPQSILLLVEGAAAEITRRLAERLAAREQALLAEYMREARKRGADAVIAMDDRTTIASRNALSMLDQSDFAVLSAFARQAEPGRVARHELSVSGGFAVQLHVRPMETSEFRSGGAAVMRVHVAEGRSATLPLASAPAPSFAGMVGESAGLRRALEAATTAVVRQTPVHILGEQGTGKRSLAHAIARQLSDDVREIAFPTRFDQVALLDQLDSGLEQGAAIVLHRVDRAPAQVRDELAAFVRLVDQPRLILTAGALTDDIAPLLSALRGVEATLPPLRSRREDIPALARHFLDESGRTEVRLAPKLRDVLVRADWPGNVAQLRGLIESTVAQVAGTEMRMVDLSDVNARTLQVSRLGRLEEAELTQIREALAEAGGNRVRAAALLGIGRSTLYRKLESYAARGFELDLG